jgi:hypothetical protein
MQLDLDPILVPQLKNATGRVVAIKPALSLYGAQRATAQGFNDASTLNSCAVSRHGLQHATQERGALVARASGADAIAPIPSPAVGSHRFIRAVIRQGLHHSRKLRWKRWRWLVGCARGHPSHEVVRA